MATRNDIVTTAKGFIGMKGKDRGEIIEWYNNQLPLPRGMKATMTQAWCALFASYCYGVNGMPEYRELSCGEMIKKAQAMGTWIEDDNHAAHIGDMIMYDWQDTGKGDNKGWPDHVGIITEALSTVYRVVEGNRNNMVATRDITKNQRYIRGYICPWHCNNNVAIAADKISVATEVIKGKWGNGTIRRKRLEAAGYDYNEIQSIVNEIYRKE